MALNIKILFPKDHPEVTYPIKHESVASSFSDNQMELEKDNLKEKEIEEDVKRVLGNGPLKRLLDKIA